jgi:hypothetical protein
LPSVRSRNRAKPTISMPDNQIGNCRADQGVRWVSRR